MSDIAIRVENLSKLYRIGAKEEQPSSMGQAMRSLVASPFAYLQRMRRPPTEEETLWALRDVSFEVKHGEVLGIIGRNGAGKSTLLKILSRITEPSSGQAQVFGRIASLLEVGTGFHPELTGRENIYLNGAILGMKRSEIDRKFDEIVDFSGVERFLDTPVKRYSSGMYVRLAFAVAAHLQPEILVVDEVLAVGDIDFQGKCLAHMRKLSLSGVAVLFVSHNLLAVRDFCVRGLLLADGLVALDSNIDQVVSTYRRSVTIPKTMSGVTDYFSLIALRANSNEIVHTLTCTPNQHILLDLEIEVFKPIYDVFVNLHIELPSGSNVLHLRSDVAGLKVDLLPGHDNLFVNLTGLPLSPGVYAMHFRLASLHPENGFVWDTERVTLEVEGYSPLAGIVWPEHMFSYKCSSGNSDLD